MTLPSNRNEVWNVCSIHFIGFATLAESLLFILLFTAVLNDTYSARYAFDEIMRPLPDMYNLAETVVMLALTVYGVRLFFAVFLIVGHIFRNLKVLLSFIIYMGVGIALNVLIGIMGSNNRLTSGYARFCYWVIPLHILYISISWRVLKAEFEKRLIVEQPRGPVGHVPNGSPVQVSFNVAPNQWSQEAFNGNSGVPVRLCPAGYDNPNMQNGTMTLPYPPPPKYSEIDEHGGGSTRQNAEKPAN